MVLRNGRGVDNWCRKSFTSCLLNMKINFYLFAPLVSLLFYWRHLLFLKPSAKKEMQTFKLDYLKQKLIWRVIQGVLKVWPIEFH